MRNFKKRNLTGQKFKSRQDEYSILSNHNSKNSFEHRNVIVFDAYIKISHKKSYADQHHCQGLTYPYQVCISDFPH